MTTSTNHLFDIQPKQTRPPPIDSFLSTNFQPTFIDDSSPMDLTLAKTIDPHCQEPFDRYSVSSLTAHTASTTITHNNILSQKISSPSSNVSSAASFSASNRSFLTDGSNIVDANNQELVTVQNALRNVASLLPLPNDPTIQLQ